MRHLQTEKVKLLDPFRGGAAAALGRPVLLRDSGTESSINGGEGKVGRGQL